MLKGRRDDIVKAFLGLYGETSDEETALFLTAISTLSDHELRTALTTWMRFRRKKPTPFEILNAAKHPSLAEKISMRELMQIVCEEHCLSEGDIKGPLRKSYIVEARQDFMYRARQAGISAPRVGAFINRDHSSVLSGVKQHVIRLAQDKGGSVK